MSRGFLAASLMAFVGCIPCEDVGASFDEACLTGPMAADSTLEIEARQNCGSSCAGDVDCAAVVDLDTIRIVATQTECLLDCQPDGTCQRQVTRCLIPPLSPGEYEVVFPGLASKTLRIQPGATTSCLF